MNASLRILLKISLPVLLACAAPALADTSIAANVTFARSAHDAAVPASLAPYLDSDYQDELGRFRLLSSFDLEIHADRVIETVTVISRYQTIDESHSAGNTRIHIDGSSGNLRIGVALVVLPSGEVRPVDPATIQVVDDNEDLVFSDSQIVVVPWPALEPGATTVLQYTDSVDVNELVVPWSWIYYPRKLHHVQRFELTARWDQEAGAPNWYSTEEGFGCKAAATMLTCAADALEPFPTDESVNYYDRMPQIGIGYKTGWSDIRRIVRGFVEEAMTADPKVVAKARELTQGQTTEAGKLSAIHEFVARDVRYVGLEHGHYSHVPRPSEVTLARRYGDCKDKTTLLLDMLRAVGIEAGPVLVSTHREDPDRLQIPASGYFDHLIACGEFGDGRPFCLDPTDAYSDPSHLGSWLQGAVALHLDSEDGPVKLPQETHRWRLDEKLAMTVSADGSLSESLTLSYDGPYAAQIRSSIAGMPRDERADWALEIYNDVVSSRVEPEFVFDGVDGLSDRLEVASQVTYDELLPHDENLYYTEDAVWLDRLLGYFVSGNEHYPYEFNGLQFTSTVTIEVDENWKPDRTSPDLDFRTVFGTLTRTHTIDGQTFRIETLVRMPHRRIEVDELEAFNRFLRTMQKHSTLKVKAPLRD